MDGNSDDEIWTFDWDPTLVGWGFPDWEIEETYRTKDWDMNRWRWEFLRRRSDYQAAFDAAFSVLHAPVELPPDIEQETVDSLLPRIRCWPFPHPNAADFGLDAMYDPLQSNWYSLGPEWRESGLIYGEKIGAGLSTFTFDLSQPLKPQLRELERELEDEQFHHLVYGPGREEQYPPGDEMEYWENTASKEVRSSKRHPEKWLTYLRVIDGRNAGASWSQIFEIVLRSERPTNENGPQLARGVWERASALMKDWPA